jgi:hypothetical protein
VRRGAGRRSLCPRPPPRSASTLRRSAMAQRLLWQNLPPTHSMPDATTVMRFRDLVRSPAVRSVGQKHECAWTSDNNRSQRSAATVVARLLATVRLSSLRLLLRRLRFDCACLRQQITADLLRLFQHWKDTGDDFPLAQALGCKPWQIPVAYPNEPCPWPPGTAGYEQWPEAQAH